MENQIISLFIFGIIIWLIGLSYYLFQTVSHYHKLISVSGKENIAQILNDIIAKLGDNKKDINEVRNALSEIKLDGINNIQKIGLVRFNPFEDTGGDQSFIMALMDGGDNGIVLTSLHNRGVTRWYAKNIKKGQGIDVQLSKEEEKAVKIAIASRNKRSEKHVDTK